MKKPRLHVTDHALIRYLERVRGVDIEALRRKVGRHVDLAEAHDGANGVISGGFIYRISGRAVVSVTPQNQPDRRTGGAGRKGARDD